MMPSKVRHLDTRTRTGAPCYRVSTSSVEACLVDRVCWYIPYTMYQFGIRMVQPVPHDTV